MGLADAGTPEQFISTYFRSRLTYHSACVNPPPGVIGTFQPLYNCLVKLAINYLNLGNLCGIETRGLQNLLLRFYKNS